MVRLILGTVAGVIVAMLIISLCEMGAHAAWPAPPPPAGPTGFPASLDTIPLSVLIAVPIGWFLGALGGGVLANRITKRALSGWIVAGVILAATIFALVVVPSPLWMVVAGLGAPILAGWLASRTLNPA